MGVYHAAFLVLGGAYGGIREVGVTFDFFWRWGWIGVRGAVGLCVGL